MAILAGDHPSESVKVRHSSYASDNLTSNQPKPGADWGNKSYREYIVSGALPVSLPLLSLSVLFLSFPPLPSFLFLSFPFPSPFLPSPSHSAQRSGPQIQLGGMGSAELPQCAVNSSSGVRGGAPAANAFFCIF